MTTRALLLLVALLAAAAAQNYQQRQPESRKRSPQAYYKKPLQPQQSTYYERPSRQLAYNQRPQQAAYNQRPQQAAYYQPQVQQAAYYQPQQAYYQPPPQQPASYQPYQPLSVPPAYQPLQYTKPKKKKEGQDLSKVPGTPGVDYPIYHTVPETSFHCDSVPATPGIYANVETGCQAYHVCHDGREGHQGASFLCTNGTLFNQKEFACDWWYNVNCAEAPTLYSLNADPLTNPYSPKPKKEDILAPGLNYYHP